ncbi:hypothetical protein J14TS2_15940 [Bacillus sp. J14TS2]|uniref:hypothetical protein n=1 Tax=Bacillus sp. J14TS2 TaxID=2807188 RepID=UPI001B00FCA1|nr:hypothetical protein [Bacillus sp. J14TS2]GIN71119.1 hypothetical protein J14TS2_15940 [Bacillus sp. J14TS2]
MNIIIKSSTIQFKNPTIGQPSRAVEEHYFGRVVTAVVDGEEKMYRFKPEKLPYHSDEEGMIAAIEERVIEEHQKEHQEEQEEEMEAE